LLPLRYGPLVRIVQGVAVRERADAARNRSAVLAAAEALFAHDDLEHVGLALIADAAGVGKATVLRGFGSLGGLVEAIIAPKVVALRHAVEAGPAPLGPGGEPGERLATYLDALLDFVLANRGLIRALEHRGPYAYYDNPASRFWIDELSRRLAAVHPGRDADFHAHVLFTAVRADVLDYLRGEQHMAVDRIRAGLHVLAER
jgi:AcrR family transcriptional regulator